MDEVMKIIASLEEFGLLTKRVKETNENEAKEQKAAFRCMLLGTLCFTLLRNMLAI